MRMAKSYDPLPELNGMVPAKSAVEDAVHRRQNHTPRDHLIGLITYESLLAAFVKAKLVLEGTSDD